ncbi:MAG: glycosyltransferase, partial [Cyanobacteriota bacterium]
KSLNIGNGDAVVGFIGRIVEEKGILELIEAFIGVIERIPNAKLLVIGETLMSERDQQVKVKIKELIETGKVKDSIIFTGYRRDIPELLSVMDVFVLPSWREGMPMTIIEAMASGKPVVATRIRGSREEVVDGETGILIPVRDSNNLTEAIVKILSDSKLARTMGENGRKRATELYSRNITIKKQLAIYRRVMQDIRDKA